MWSMMVVIFHYDRDHITKTEFTLEFNYFTVGDCEI